LLLFHSCGPPRHLHSFPTRRSSDLTQRRGAGPARPQELHTETVASAGAFEALAPGDPHVFGIGSAADRQSKPPGGASLDGIPARSEEHTSELQSQSNLVCRLLLEKK